MRIKKANGCLFAIYRAVFKPFLYFRYKVHFNRKIAKKLKTPCVIISNHQTMLDQFIVGSCFNFPINFVASDGVLTHNFAGWCIRTFARAIPIRKGTVDATAIKNIIGVIRQGGAVGIFPEGNTSFFGETGNFKPTVGKLAKKLGVPLIVTEIRGGYNTVPRWKYSGINRGRIDVGVKRVLTPEQMETMSGDEINAYIAKEMYFNEYEGNAEKKIKYRGKRRAEYLESVLFACPECGSMKDMRSEKNDFYCGACGARVRINQYGFFDKINNAQKLPDTILEWSRIQLEMLKKLDFENYTEKALFTDGGVKLIKSTRGKKRETVTKNRLSIFNDRIEVGNNIFKMCDINEVAVQRARKLFINMNGGESYTVLAPKRISMLKYMISVYRIKILNNNEEEGYYGY